jgi:predicted HNH restriction endonuclease
MTKVFAVPIGKNNKINKKNFKNTILSLSNDYKNKIKNIINLNINDFRVWGWKNGKMNSRLWASINSNDIIIFVENNKLTYTNTIKTVENKEISKLLWNKEDWNLTIILTYLFQIDITKKDFIKKLGYNENDRLMGTRNITNNFKKLIDNNPDFCDKINIIYKKNIFNNISLSSNNKLKRNKKIIIDLKKEKKYSCEVCGFSFEKKNGGNYCEGAHILPFAKSKIDTKDNMIILCANHHKMLDYGTDTDKKYVLEKCNVTEDLIEKFFKMNM